MDSTKPCAGQEGAACFPWTSLPHELRSHVVGSLLGHQEQAADWDTWMRQWKEGDTAARVKHQAAAAARTSSRELCSMVNATATALRVTASDEGDRSLVSQPLRFNLGRFPALTRLGVDVDWDSCRDPDSNEDYPCRIYLDDAPPSLCELRVASARGGLSEKYTDPICHAALAALPPAPLPSLVTLELFSISMLETGLPLERFPALTRLVLDTCEGFEEDEHGMRIDFTPAPQLQHLHLTGNTSVEPPQISHLSHLTHLSFKPCPGGVSDTGFTELDLSLPGSQPRTALVHLDLKGNDLAGLDLSCVPNLRHLAVSHCSSLQALGISPCTQLTHLDAAYLDHLTSLDVRPCATSLKELDVDCCPALGRVQGLSRCTGLETLSWERCPLSTLDLSFGRLKTVHLECSAITSLRQVPPGLQELVCRTSLHLTELHMAHCTSLRAIGCMGCPLSNCELPAAPHLTRLECTSPSPHLPLDRTPSLQRLAIYSCPTLTSLQLQHTPQLTSLQVEICPDLTSLPLHCVPQLQHLTVFSMPHTFMLDLPHLSQLRSLSIGNLVGFGLSIDLSGCSQQLTRLCISGCESLLSLKGFNQCTALKELRLEGCPRLGSLDVRHCRALGTMVVGGQKMSGIAR